MAASLLYDNEVSGAAMVTAIGTVSGSDLFGVTYANGQRVVLIQAPGDS